ncbi:MAG TPA: NUDIX hydrolase [Candidatus Glassbacteria bacterium]|nr:NUDIX hydrolase [Candidatus Glassbacteria bacterium]
MKTTKRKQITDLPFLNLFEATYEHEGKEGKWTYASRSTSKPKECDAVMVVGIVMKDTPKIVLIKQYRVPVGEYIIEFPAGLLDKDETIEVAAKREFEEETGMKIKEIKNVSPPTFNSAGITDETVAMVFASVEGEPSTELNESSEDIEILVLDKNQLLELIKDEQIKWSAKAWMYCGFFSNF